MKRFLFLLLILPALAFAQVPDPQTLVVDFFDVGQADCILVRQGEFNLLIDAGNNADRQVIEDNLRRRGVTRLDVVVATHAHEDHIGSMDAVVTDFDVGAIWFPRQTANTATWRDFVAAVKARGLTFLAPAPGKTFLLGTARCTFLGPVDDQVSDPNEGSAVLRVDFGSTSFLFTGDAGRESEERMLAGAVPLEPVTVLKVGHHGSAGSTSAAFLQRLNPQFAVISVGMGNTYGHPSKVVEQRLRKAAIETYRTDLDGTVEAVSDGKVVVFTPTGPSPHP